MPAFNPKREESKSASKENISEIEQSLPTMAVKAWDAGFKQEQKIFAQKALNLST